MTLCATCGVEHERKSDFCGKSNCYMKHYRQTERGHKATRAAAHRFYQTERGKEMRAKDNLKYYGTEKGRRYLKRRYEKYGNGLFWREKANCWIFVEERPCARCGESNKSLLECDHILAKCLGGIDEENNLQILCERCHKEKTKSDLVLWRSV